MPARLLLTAAAAASLAADAPARIIRLDPDGTARVERFVFPPSAYLDAASRRVLETSEPTEGPGAPAPPAAPALAETRRLLAERLQPAVEHMRALYPVDIEETTIGGVSVAVVTPRGGVPARNRGRVLINAPGGGFRIAQRSNGLLNSIPAASVGGFKVVTVSYRQGPEDRFPAGSDDVTAVYRALLKTYRPQAVGMFGCSAGAAVTAEAVAALPRAGLPRPGVLGLYCAGAGARFDGDGWYFSRLELANDPSSAPGGVPDYFQGHSLDEPAVTPANDLAVIGRFPPTIYVVATRDSGLSAAAFSHRQMQKAGVESQLLVYDGLYHNFMSNPDLAESREVYALTSRFYDRHLAR